MRYAAKSDANQAQIVAELRKLGYDVDIVSREKGLYDILVSGCASWSRGHAVAVRVEIKASAAAPFTEDELEYWGRQHWHDNLIRAEHTGDVMRWFGAIPEGLRP